MMCERCLRYQRRLQFAWGLVGAFLIGCFYVLGVFVIDRMGLPHHVMPSVYLPMEDLSNDR